MLSTVRFSSMVVHHVREGRGCPAWIWVDQSSTPVGGQLMAQRKKGRWSGRGIWTWSRGRSKILSDWECTSPVCVCVCVCGALVLRSACIWVGSHDILLSDGSFVFSFLPKGPTTRLLVRSGSCAKYSLN
jgi:hypothetical protein